MFFNLTQASNEDYICKKVYYFLIQTNQNYTNIQLQALQNSILNDTNISLSNLKEYASNFNENCNSSGLYLPSQKRQYNSIVFFDFNASRCNYLIDKDVAGYDLDTSLNFFKIYLSENASCSQINFWKFFSNISADEQGYYLKGLKLYIFLVPIVLFLFYDLLISHHLFKKLTTETIKYTNKHTNE